MGRLYWYLKQLTPRTYWTHYGDVQEQVDGRTVAHHGQHHFVIWKMWLGRCYDVIDVPVCGDAQSAPGARAACYPLPSNE